MTAGLATTWVHSAVTGPMDGDDFESLVYQGAESMFGGLWHGEEAPTIFPGAFVSDCETHDPTHDEKAWFDTNVGFFTWAGVWDDWRLAGYPPVIEVADPKSAHRNCKCTRAGSGSDC